MKIIGGGSTQRLTRLVGIKTSLDLLSSGKIIDAEEAKKLNIIDYISEISNVSGSFDSTSRTHTGTDIGTQKYNYNQYIDELFDYAMSDFVQQTPLIDRRISCYQPTNTDINQKLYMERDQWEHILKEITKTSKGLIAPLAILEAVKAASTSKTFAEGLQFEENILQVLLKGTQTNALQYLYFAEKKYGILPTSTLNTFTGIENENKSSKFLDIHNVGVIGGKIV